MFHFFISNFFQELKPDMCLLYLARRNVGKAGTDWVGEWAWIGKSIGGLVACGRYGGQR